MSEIKSSSPPVTSNEDRLRRRVLAALLPDAPRTMTYDEFLAWVDEDTLAEWVDGEVIMASPASLLHQDVAGFLYQLLSDYAALRDLGKVIVAPFQMKLPQSSREPDVMFLRHDHLDRLQPTYLDGPADLVVEIVSPESARRDRGEKFYEYAQAGVPEYWLIDPQAHRAEFFTLDEDGYYVTAMRGAGGEYHSRAVAGFWLKVEWLWQRPLPEVEEALLAIGGEAYAQRWIERLRRQGFLPAD